MRLGLSKRTGDAVRILMYLAGLPRGERRTSAQLAEACQVRAGNVPTLVSYLSRADLLVCVPGPGGGCALSRDPAAITIADAIVAIEGSLEPDHCAVDDLHCREREFPCGLHETFVALIRNLNHSLGSLTLAEARRRHDVNRLVSSGQAMTAGPPSDDVGASASVAAPVSFSSLGRGPRPGSPPRA